MTIMFSTVPTPLISRPTPLRAELDLRRHDTALAIRTLDVDVPRRRFVGVASAEIEDLPGDLVICDGIDETEYKRNPVLLADHARGFVIGQAKRLWRQRRDGAKCLMVEAQGVPRGTSPRTDEIWATIEDGSRRGLSIGFLAKSMEERTTKDGRQGLIFKTSRLLEISSVDIPACPTCMVTEKSICAHARRAEVPRGGDVALYLLDDPAPGILIGSAAVGARALTRRLQGGRR